VKQQLSLNLIGSRDSSLPSVSARRVNGEDDLSFEYLQPEKNISPALKNELSLNLRSSVDSEQEAAPNESLNCEVAVRPPSPAEAQNNAEEHADDQAESFVRHLLGDPRFRPQLAEESAPKPSKSNKRPKSAHAGLHKSVTNRLYKSLNPESYQRRWASSAKLSSSRDFNLKSRGKKVRPVSAKTYDAQPSLKENKPRPVSAGFSRALLSLSQEDLSQMKDADVAANTGRYAY
jgi:hypothetical protein